MSTLTKKLPKEPKLGIIMDPISLIHPEKDTTLALALQAQARGFKLYYFETGDLFLQDGNALGNGRPLQVFDDLAHWYRLEEKVTLPLQDFEILLMRKDPPVDLNYLYATHILERAEKAGVLVVNRPQALREANEKLFATWFADLMPPTVVSADKRVLQDFIHQYQTVVLKPLDSMGGKNVFKCESNDPNRSALIDLLTLEGKLYIMAQQYIPDIIEVGDKRILLLDGEPLPYGLARIPATSDFRGNLAAGGLGTGVPLTDRDHFICKQIGPVLRQQGLTFVGIDVIGQYLTEINVTSPTCVKEIEKAFKVDIAGKIIERIIQKLE